MQPIRLDDSLTDEALSSSATSNEGFARSHYDVISSLVPKIDEHESDQLSAPDSKGQSKSSSTDTDLSEAVARHLTLHTSPSLSHGAPNSLSTGMTLHARLFDLVSSYVPRVPTSSSSVAPASQSLAMGIDHPLCRECADFCIEVMRSLLDIARKERDAFKEWNKHLESEAGFRGEEEIRKMEAEIVELEDLISKATSSLRKSEREREALEAEMRRLDIEEKQLEREEADFWAEHSRTLLEESDREEARATLLRGIQTGEATLARLEATNVFFDAFAIGHEQGSSSGGERGTAAGTGLATINGLRFGRTATASSSSSSSAVDWNEVNAAWGQVALLLETLRVRIGKIREFKGWRIHPKGSTSYLDKVVSTGEDQARSSHADAASSTSSVSNEPHELHHPNSWASLTRVLHLRRFDAAMVGVLDCTAQLYRWTEEDGDGGEDGQAQPPRMVHAINGDRIGDYSVRLVGAFTSEENWSRAMKYLLVK